MKNILGKKIENFAVTQYTPLVYDDFGTKNGGSLKLVNQETFEEIYIYNNLSLRKSEWYTNSFDGVSVRAYHLKDMLVKLEQAIKSYKIKDLRISTKKC